MNIDLIRNRGDPVKTCDISGGNKPDEDQIQRLKEFMKLLPNDSQFEEYSDNLKALSDPTRLKILYLLSNDELCGCEIIYALDKPQSSISHHLNILKNSGFIKGRKVGVWIYYSLTDPKIANTVQELINLI